MISAHVAVLKLLMGDLNIPGMLLYTCSVESSYFKGAVLSSYVYLCALHFYAVVGSDLPMHDWDLSVQIHP